MKLNEFRQNHDKYKSSWPPSLGGENLIESFSYNGCLCCFFIMNFCLKAFIEFFNVT